MKLADLLKPETLEDIRQQATANCIASFQDEFFDKIVGHIDKAPLTDEMKETLKLFFDEGFKLGVSSGTGEATLLILQEIVKG